MVEQLKTKLSDFKTYWKIPMPGRYMTFKEIVAYAGGGIGAYFLIYMGNQLVVSINNMIVGGAIGISPTHMYLLYIIATLSNIPLTAIRANMIDNTRNKAGKYRPYLISMGIPTALIAIGYVWFPYDALYSILPMQLFGFEGGYIAKCAIVLVFNLLLQFFFNFFNDAYTNLIHVLSPNTQERTDVLAIKSVVYSLAPSIANIVLPLVAQAATNNDLYDIRVYRITYPIFAILGIGFTILVFAYTKEKIVQAKTRVIQVRFIDSFKAVAKNKYFWIIALAGWLGFLESSYGNIISWTYNYGHACSGGTMSIINTVISNASLWGMVLAPFCIRAFGKKKVLIGINTMNIICILAMGINKTSIIWLAVCVYLNWLFGAFEQITTPAIQADIRDYHQYKTGERIDGMFATVQTIGNIVTLITSSVVPFVYESYGIYEGNGYESPYDILDVTTGQEGLLEKVIGTLIIMAAIGAFLNMVPYLFYDLKEKDQKGIIRILRVRALFEDYGNGALGDAELVEAVDIIRNARETANLTPKAVDKALKKADKKAYREALRYNEEIEISQFVCKELDKFSSEITARKLKLCETIYSFGLDYVKSINLADAAKELEDAKALPKATEDEKDFRDFAIGLARNKIRAYNTVEKYYKNKDLIRPDFAVLDKLYKKEDELNEEMKALYLKLEDAKTNNKELAKEIKAQVKAVKKEKENIQKQQKAEMDLHARFNQAAKPFLDAEKLFKEKENFTHLEEISAEYDEAKARVEAERAAQLAEQKRLDEEKAAQKAAIKAEKEAAKAAKKNK